MSYGLLYNTPYVGFEFPQFRLEPKYLHNLYSFMGEGSNSHDTYRQCNLTLGTSGHVEFLYYFATTLVKKVGRIVRKSHWSYSSPQFFFYMEFQDGRSSKPFSCGVPKIVRRSNICMGFF